MYSDDRKIAQRMAPMLKRVLIIDPQTSSARILIDLLRDIAPGQHLIAPTMERGLTMAWSSQPQIIFVEHVAGAVDGIEFTRQLRRGDMQCRKAPVVMVTASATAALITGARDAGVHEFLRKPYTIRDLMRRLEAVFLRPRDWVEAVHYIGPDRRRFNSGDYDGPLKRRSDAQETPDEARIIQALKILRAAAGAAHTHPAQALRAMQAQADILREAAQTTENPVLLKVAGDFQSYLAAAAEKSGAAPADSVALVAPLLAFLPPEEDAKKGAAA